MNSLAENLESPNSTLPLPHLTWLTQIKRWVGLFVIIFRFIVAQTLGLKSKRLIRNQFWANKLLRLLNIHVQIQNDFPQGTYLLVCNHSTWLDPVIINSVFPVNFITSTDVEVSALLGSITKSAGCLFCSRKPWTLKSEIQQFQSIINQYGSLGFFPEATSNDGNGILKFRSSLFELAIQLKIPVLPIVIHWENPCVHYFGDHLFIPHLARIIQESKIHCKIQVLDPIDPRIGDRKTLSKMCEELIRAQLHTQKP